MDRQAFKQRMQNLKSYRENNPGKGYWDWKVETFADGGEVGDPEKERFYQATGRSSSGRPLEEGLKPVFSLEDAANMTPIGDAISAKDAYDAVKNRDWLGAGLAAVTMIPFVPTTVRNFRKKYKGVTPKREIPTVNKKAIDNAIDEAKNYRDSRIKLYQQAIEDRNASYERLIENEDALRRAVNFDKKYGTNYVKTYTKQLQNYATCYSTFDPRTDPLYSKDLTREELDALTNQQYFSEEELKYYFDLLVSRYCLYDKEPDTEENEPEEDIDDAIDELKREINELKEIQ